MNRKPTFVCPALLLAVCLTLFAGGTGWAADRELTLATTPWPPYAGHDLKAEGYAAEIVVQGFKRAGYEVTIDFYPWPDALESARSGKVDGLFPIYRESGRESDFVFSDPIAESPLGLFKTSPMPGKTPLSASSKPAEDIEYSADPRVDREAALEGLTDYTFGIVRGYANPAVIQSEKFEVIKAVNDRENMENLMEGRVDLAVMDRRVGLFLITQHHLWRKDQVAFMEPPLSVRPLFLALSKKRTDAEKLVEAFNRGVDSLEADGILKRIKESHQIK